METMNDTAGRPEVSATADLRQLAEKYKIRWSVYPEWGPDAKWQQQKVGFVIELVGTHFQPQHPPTPGCNECKEVYEALHRIADEITPKGERPSRSEIERFDGRLSISSRRGLHEEVTLTIRLVHGADYRQPVDECENACLQEMERNLARLGARRV